MEQKKSFTDYIPQYVIAGTGIIYATGFLVVLAFLDRFGIRESGAELWKARYIHIGIICIAFPLIINGTILSLTHLIFYGKHNKSLMWQRLLPIGLLVINLEIVCFILLMLTRRSNDGTGIVGLIPVQWIIGLTLIGIPAILSFERVLEKFTKKLPKDDNELKSLPHNLTVSLRWILTLIVAVFNFWFFLEFKQNVSAKFPWLGFTYIGFSLLLCLLISTVTTYEKRQETEGRRKAINILAVSIIGPFFYLVILSFSYGIYQNIPSTRGGGDYTVSPKVIMTFKNDLTITDIDKKYFNPNNPKISIPLIVIEETSWAFFLADPKESGGPQEWKQIGGKKPEILIINKSEIEKIKSESRNTIEQKT